MAELRSLAIYTFCEALQYLKIEQRAKRSLWEDNAYIFYDKDMKTIYKQVGNTYSPWEVPQGDLLAEDWVVIKDV